MKPEPCVWIGEVAAEQFLDALDALVQRLALEVKLAGGLGDSAAVHAVGLDRGQELGSVLAVVRGQRIEAPAHERPQRLVVSQRPQQRLQPNRGGIKPVLAGRPHDRVAHFQRVVELGPDLASKIESPSPRSTISS